MTSLTDQRLALALEAAQLGTWTWTMATASTVWNERLEELHGLKPGEFGGTFEDWLASLHPEDRAECVARVERALADPGPYVLQHRTIWADGSVHHIECRGMVLVDEAGVPTGTTGVAIDVTDRELQAAAATRALVEQHEVIDTLQQALLPATLPQVRGTSIATRYVAAQTSPAVGGDWYAVLPLPGDRLGLAIGDVAGHGLDAVADMAAARFSLRALALGEPAPENVLARLNDVVHVFESNTMITAIYGVLDPGAQEWSYATAGHCPAMLRDAEGNTRMLDERCDPPLGIAGSFRRHTTPAASGSTLVLYTDGLVERRTELITIGLERLRATCDEGPADPEELCDYLLDVMLRDAAPTDDVAMVVVSVE
jgi:PAS domain S-box-containing protein